VTGTATTATIAEIGELFLMHLPRVRAHARYALPHVPCPDARADLVAEVVGLAWKHFLPLARRGKRPESFVATLAWRCSQAVRAGRRLAGAESPTDALSPLARARFGVAVERVGAGPGVPAE
jgi:hypothetical protein